MHDSTSSGVVQAAIIQLQPLCSKLAKEHTRGNLSSLRRAIQDIDPNAISELSEYILFPLRIMMKTSEKQSEDYFVDLFECINLTLSKCSISRAELFVDLFNMLCIHISSPGGASIVKPSSEELKLIIVKCITSLCKALDERLCEDVFVPEFLPVCGHAVTVLLHMATEEQMRSLRVAAITALQNLAMLDKNLNIRQQTVLGDTFASYLPGIVIGLGKVITGDYKQGHHVTCAALETWYRIVILVIGDESVMTAQKCEGKKEVSLDVKLQTLQVTRSSTWVQNTREKLVVLVKKISKLKSHEDWRVRLALECWATKLLNECSKSLENGASLFLEILVSLVADEYSEVSEKSQTSLRLYRDKAIANNARPLYEVLEESLHTLTSSLPLLMRTAEDDQKVSSIRLLNGYLRLLGSRSRSMLLSYSHLSRLSLALVQISELNCSRLSPVQERLDGPVLAPLTQNHTHKRHRKDFKHFVSDDIEKEIVKTCRLLGYYGDIHLLVDHFLDLFHQSSAYRKQAIFIINEMLLGSIGLGVELDASTPIYTGAKPDIPGLIGALLEEYLLPENFNLLLNNTGTSFLASNRTPDLRIVSHSKVKNNLTIEKLNSNILQVCLILEGVANCSMVIGRDFRYHLMHVLYQILEKLSVDCIMVNQTAYLTLLEVASASQYSSPEDLLCSNADYLVNAISARMRHIQRNPHTPGVLQVILTYSGKDILPLVEDTANEVLVALDHYYGDHAGLFMSVIHALTVVIKTWYPYQPHEEEEIFKRADLTSVPARTQTVFEYLAEYVKNRKIASGDFSEDDDFPDDTPPNIDEAKEEDYFDDEKRQKEQPIHIKIICNVLERCCHLLSCENPRVRLLVLEVTAESCLTLQSQYDLLLPLIHKVWPSLCHRFQDEEELVVVKAYDILTVLSSICGDFIRSRCVKDVLPKMTSSLSKLATKSVKAGPAYRYTVAFKLQHRVLSAVGPLCRQCDITEESLTAAIHACIPYLSIKQPVELQLAAVASINHFILLEPESVWLALIRKYCPKAVTAPSDEFYTLKNIGTDRRNEFADNVIQLLEKCG